MKSEIYGGLHYSTIQIAQNTEEIESSYWEYIYWRFGLELKKLCIYFIWQRVYTNWNFCFFQHTVGVIFEQDSIAV